MRLLNISFTLSASKSPYVLREQLNSAIKLSDKEALSRAILECEAAGFPELSYDLSQARLALESLGGGRGG